MSIEVRTHPGQLPEFWDRSVIFFANLLSLFYGNEGQTQELAEHVGGINSYGGRLLPIINLLFRGAENLLVLERAPNRALCEYFERELGLTLPAQEVLEDSEYITLLRPFRGVPATGKELVGERIREHPAPWVDGFVTDDQLTRVAQSLGKSTLSSEQGSKRGNNKFLLHQHLEERGHRVFDTVLAESPDEVRHGLAKLRKKGYARAVLKSQIGASGFGMLRVPTMEDGSLEIPDHLFFEGACLVQGWLDETVRDVAVIGSPSVQMFVSDKAVSLYDLTEQILSSDSIHEGNLAPSPALAAREQLAREILDLAAETGRWLHAQEYRGTASADFQVIARNGRFEVRVCELNARVTGATYPSILARHFKPDGAWLMRNLRFRSVLDGHELLNRLQHSGGLLGPSSDRGVLPFNFNPDRQGRIAKGQFLCVGDTVSDCAELLARAESVLPVDWEYDRD